MKSGQRMAGIVLSVLGLVFLVAIWGEVLFGEREANALEMMFPVAYLLFAGFFTVRAFRNMVSLTESAIELRGITDCRVLPFDKINGRRRYLVACDENAPSVWHLVLEPNDDRFPKLDFEETYRFDDAFYAWFSKFPDLDARDKVKHQDSNFGLV